MTKKELKNRTSEILIIKINKVRVEPPYYKQSKNKICTLTKKQLIRGHPLL